MGKKRGLPEGNVKESNLEGEICKSLKPVQGKGYKFGGVEGI